MAKQDQSAERPAIPLLDLLSSMESGSRPRGGVRGILTGIPSLGGEHLSSEGGFNFQAVKYVPTDFYSRMRRGHIQPGDILIVKDGATTGKVSIVREDFPFKRAVVNEHVFVCRPSTVSSEYLFWFLHSAEGQRRILEHFRGSAQGGITHDFAKKTLVPIAPEHEQTLIAELLNNIDRHGKSFNVHLGTAIRSIERFRQSVLAAACSGRLTADWREDNPATFNEVSEILSACRSERTEVGGRMATMSVIPTSYSLPSLPPEWQWQSLDELAIRVADADHKMPKARAVGVPYISTKDFTQTGIDFSSAKRISQEDFAYLTKKIRPTAGDILISRYGTVGEVRFVETSIPFQASYSIAIVKTTSDDSLSRWISLCLRSTTCQAFMREHIRASAQPDVGLQHIRQIPIPVAPPQEQAEITRLTEALFTYAGGITERLEAATRDIGRSTQAVLGKAFRGHLTAVPSPIGFDRSFHSNLHQVSK